MIVVREKEVPFEVIYRLATPTGKRTLGAMIEMARRDWRAEQPTCNSDGGDLPPNHYRAFVDYAPPPPMSELEVAFSGKGSVSNIFNGRRWRRHPSCTDINETPGERIFFVKQFDRITEEEAGVTEMKKQGYHPAIHLEAIAFARAFPELQQKSWIYAFGSAIAGGGPRCITVLRLRNGKRNLRGSYFYRDNKLEAQVPFLFVRDPV